MNRDRQTTTIIMMMPPPRMPIGSTWRREKNWVAFFIQIRSAFFAPPLPTHPHKMMIHHRSFGTRDESVNTAFVCDTILYMFAPFGIVLWDLCVTILLIQHWFFGTLLRGQKCQLTFLYDTILYIFTPLGILFQDKMLTDRLHLAREQGNKATREQG